MVLGLPKKEANHEAALLTDAPSLLERIIARFARVQIVSSDLLQFFIGKIGKLNHAEA